MKYVWDIEIILKSGEHICGQYSGAENNSDDVAKLLIMGSTANVNAISGGDKKQLWFIVGEVAACIISASNSQ